MLDVKEIFKSVPHRFPFLLVDRIVEIHGSEKIVGIKNVSINEHYLSRELDGSRVLPPTILTEAVAQVGEFGGDGGVAIGVDPRRDHLAIPDVAVEIVGEGGR